MSDAAQARDLMDLWAHGWALTRQCSPPLRFELGWYIHVGLPGQTGRYVLDRVAWDEVGTIARRVDVAQTFIKAWGRPAAIALLLPTGWEIVASDYLMTVSLSVTPQGTVPPDYTVALAMDRVFVVEIRCRDGELAASGRAALVEDWCVFDQIVTSPEHRRRGLGRIIMERLAMAASTAGAGRGLLVATDEGRLLYERLGWTMQGPITSAVSLSSTKPRM